MYSETGSLYAVVANAFNNANIKRSFTDGLVNLAPDSEKLLLDGIN